MIDNWTARLFQKFPSPEELVGEDSLAVIGTLAIAIETSTSRTESAHSQNFRHIKSRVQSRQMSAATVALKGAAFVGPTWMHQLVEPHKNKPQAKKRGRPAKHKGRQEGAQKRRRGGGGAWRAFCHTFSQNRAYTRASLREQAQEYNNLSQDDWDRFNDLGKLGLPRGQARQKQSHTDWPEYKFC